jgi:hypothetical protein
MSSLYKNGIDTEKERRVFEYKPELKLSDRPPTIGDVDEYTKTDIIDELSKRYIPMSQSISGVINVCNRINNLLYIAENQLVNHIAIINPQNDPVTSAAIKEKEGGSNNSVITFSLYKQCLSNNDSNSVLICDAYEDSLAGTNGSVAGDTYSLLTTLSYAFNNFKTHLFDLCGQKNGTDEGMLSNIKTNDNEIIEKLSSLDSNGNEYKKVKNKHDVINAISGYASDRAENIDGVLDGIEWGLSSTVSDSFNGEQYEFVLRIIQIVSIHNKEVDSALRKLRNIIRMLKIILVLSLDNIEKGYKFVRDKVNTLLYNPLQPLQDETMKALSKLKASINMSVAEVLNNLITDYKSCLPIESMSYKIMGMINNIEDEFTNKIIGLFRNNRFESRLLNNSVSIITEKKAIRDYYNVLDKLEKNLDSVKYYILNNKVEDWIKDFLFSNNLN